MPNKGTHGLESKSSSYNQFVENTMKYNALILTIVTSIASILIAIILVPPFRFESLTLSERRSGSSSVLKTELLRFNRLTGSTARLDDGKWLAIQSSEAFGKLLPIEAEVSVTGKAGFDIMSPGFSVSLYNGSPYRISGIVLSVKIEAEEPKDGYERLFFEEVDIAPLSEGTISFTITRPTSYKNHTWSIDKLYGEKILD
jgi:hypothetical protein